jgi:hypothetical protein
MMSLVISFPAPAMCQRADEDRLIELGEAVMPGCVTRSPDENGLRLWVDGDPTDPEMPVEALAMFQTLLGILRTWNPLAGQLKSEERGGLGEGPIRDSDGNQWVQLGPVIEYDEPEGEFKTFVKRASLGVATSQSLRRALFLVRVNAAIVHACHQPNRLVMMLCPRQDSNLRSRLRRAVRIPG